jgi:hypothetical protein
MSFTMSSTMNTTTVPVIGEIEITRLVGTYDYTGLRLVSYEINQLRNYMIPATEQMIGMYRWDIEGLKEKIRNTPDQVTKKDNARLESAQSALTYNLALLEKQQEALRKREELTECEPTPGTLSLCRAPAGDGWSATDVSRGLVWNRT